MATERELKFSLYDDFVPSEPELRAWFDGSGVDVGTPRLVRHRDRYYDDARLSLSRAGLALRQRVGEGRVLATLKTRGRVDGGFHHREEIEEPMATREWPPAIAERLAAAVDPAALAPVLALETERVRVPLTRGGAPLAELTFDSVSGRLPGASRSVHFLELEVEACGDADEDDLREVAARLDGVLRMTPSDVTKLERARALLMAGP